MKEYSLLRWAIRALTYIVVSAAALAGLCAYEPSALCAGIVSPLVGVFWLPATYRLVDGAMTMLSDVLYITALSLFAALVTGLAPTICAWLVEYSNGACYRESGACLILTIPAYIIALGMWMWFRLKQWRQMNKAS